jgi:hypothetical protein
VKSIHQAVVKMRDNLPVFQDDMLALQTKRRDEWQQKADVLIQKIQQAMT